MEQCYVRKLVTQLSHGETSPRHRVLHQSVSQEVVSDLWNRGFSSEPRALAEVCEEFQYLVLANTMNMGHKGMFSFIPGPAAAVSWVGELLTTAFNPFAASWLEASGPTVIETRLVRELCERVGLPGDAGGIFLSGGSMANTTALAVARNERGVAVDQQSKLRVYLSDQTHCSVAKGLCFIGFHSAQLNYVPTNGRLAMQPGALRKMIEDDVAQGWLPLAIVANLGTTNSGAIDPLHDLADLRDRFKLWLHIDGAFGASVAFSSENRYLIEGVERADSVSWDPHKWLFQTYGCGCLLVRNAKHLEGAFRTDPEYLQDAESAPGQRNLWDFGPEMTRPARANRLWVSLQTWGTRKLADAIDRGIQLAVLAETLIAQKENWHIVTPASLAIVTFRFEPKPWCDQEMGLLNRSIGLESLNSGKFCVLSTHIQQKTVLRMCTIHPELTPADIADTVEALDQIARNLKVQFINRVR